MLKQSDISPLLVRIPAPLKQWLSDRAEANDRSMTGEILAIMKAVQRAEQRAVQ
ncbi:Arc family DNA-binding protein [Neorhizobium galegae]|jgi:hypothetical protein|uniref:Arc-like DNA binding domain-containing protein n=1 Tax=Neorhizobium galegae bv. officinalis TaxID=323656 RepID=A0A0T7H1I7_NEOGA|nr:Hypothetical protein NGAL_HAMBI1189_49550 [Neorhizobium galegae bv. officinalis]